MYSYHIHVEKLHVVSWHQMVNDNGTLDNGNCVILWGICKNYTWSELLNKGILLNWLFHYINRELAIKYLNEFSTLDVKEIIWKVNSS